MLDIRLFAYILANLLIYVPISDVLFNRGSILDATFSMLYRVVSPVTARVEDAVSGPEIEVVDSVVVPDTDRLPPIVWLACTLDVITLEVVAYRVSVVIAVKDAVDSVVWPTTLSVPAIVVVASAEVPVAYRFVVDRLDVDALFRVVWPPTVRLPVTVDVPAVRESIVA